MLSNTVKNYLTAVKSLPFFYVVGDEEYLSTLNDLKQEGLEVVRISKFCNASDKFPNIDDLIDYFRTADVDFNTNKCVVIGLGEYLCLRGEKEIRRVLRKLKDTTLGNARVVLLLRGLTPYVNELLKDDIRLEGQQRICFSTVTESNIKVKSINPEIGLVKEHGIVYLLKKIEEGNNNLVFSTRLYLGDSILPIEVINDAYDIIVKNIDSFKISKQVGTEENWNRLYVDLKENNYSIDKVFANYNFIDEHIDNFYQKVFGKEYKNWLFYLYLLVNISNNKNLYLVQILNNTNNFEEFKSKILSYISHISSKDKDFDRLYTDRKKLLKGFSNSEIANFVFDNRINPSEGIYKLTDSSKIEKEEIVSLISKVGVPNNLDIIYNDLYLYLNKYIFDCGNCSDELTKYFDIYKDNKINNIVSDEILELVYKYSQSMLYTKLDTRDNVIAQISDKKNAKLCWIDALGVEYLSFIQGVANKKGLSINVSIARADLPTITSINKKFYESWDETSKVKIEDLDDIKHKEKGGFNYTEQKDPIHLVSELDIIKKVIEDAATELNLHRCKKYIITSDHGASRLAVLYNQIEKYETDTKGEHSGRCCKEFDDCDVQNSIRENGYIVLTDYGRFKRSRAANVEVHGGATLEEIIVPVITLTLNKQNNIKIKVLEPENIFADRKHGTEVKLYISDVSNKNNVSVIINGEKYPAEYISDYHYLVKLYDIKRAKECATDIYDGDDLIGSVVFTIKGKTGSVNQDFDDLF